MIPTQLDQMTKEVMTLVLIQIRPMMFRQIPIQNHLKRMKGQVHQMKNPHHQRKLKKRITMLLPKKLLRYPCFLFIRTILKKPVQQVRMKTKAQTQLRPHHHLVV
jgi:hypothetical protein